MSDLDRELEFELHRALDPLSAAPLPPRRLARAHMPARTVLGGAGAALGFKILSGVAVAAAAVTVAGAATTGSLNPTVWGQQMTQQVASCKAQLADGQHGIGDCVSTFANQHGQAVASSARQHGNGLAAFTFDLGDHLIGSFLRRGVIDYYGCTFGCKALGGQYGAHRGFILVRSPGL